MTKRGKRIDNDGQLNIFAMIAEAETARKMSSPPSMAGKLDLDKRFRALLSEALKASKYSRFEVASRMSEYVGKSITKEILDSWTAESKENHRFPLVYLPAFSVACEDSSIIRELAEECGGHYIVSEDALRLELGKIEEKEQELNKRKKAIKDYFSTFSGGQHGR